MTHDRYDNDILKQLTRIANSLEKIAKGNEKDKSELTTVNAYPTFEDQNLPNCWRCQNYDKDFSICNFIGHSIARSIDFPERTCCDKYKERKDE